MFAMTWRFNTAAAKLFFVLLAILPVGASAADGLDPDRSVIRGLLRDTWEKPDARLTADPIAIVGDHAIADWRQGVHAGRALLRRGPSGWSVVLCAGDALTDRSFLVEAGVPADQAAAIADELAAAEHELPNDVKERMARFKNVVRMQGN